MKRKLPPLKSLQIFEEAAYLLSFTQAADKLNLTQSAVSKQIKLLEDYLQSPVFKRKNNVLELTKEGETFLTSIIPALRNIEIATKNIMNPVTNMKLTILAPPTFIQRWLIPKLGKFKQMHPNIDIVINTIFDRTILEKDAHKHDISIFYGDGHLKGMHVRPLITEKHISVCSPSLLEDNGKLDISKQNLIHLSRESRAYLLWEKWLDIAELRAPTQGGNLWFDNLEGIIHAAILGYGAAIVDSNLIAEELEAKRLVQWHPSELQMPLGYWIATQNLSKSQNPALHLFKSWIVKQV